MKIKGSRFLNTILGSFRSVLSNRKERLDISGLLVSPHDALAELERRRENPEVKRRVEEFFGGDIPDYVKGDPILYLARHIVTPNFETIRFINLMGELGHQVVVSQDTKGLFVSQNLIKRALCKLPVCTRVTQKNGKLNEHYQNISIVDFNTADGKTFSELKTLWGEGLIDFHARLFTELGLRTAETPDDAEWIDRHGRGDLLEHYKQLLMLFVVHGVFFENYNLDDDHEIDFIKEVLWPACDFVEARTGYRPLIVPIFPAAPESYNFWISYPREVLDIVRKSMMPGRGTPNL
jgi:hypothetical protein